jgi:hypothetical protein
MEARAAGSGLQESFPTPQKTRAAMKIRPPLERRHPRTRTPRLRRWRATMLRRTGQCSRQLPAFTLASRSARWPWQRVSLCPSSRCERVCFAAATGKLFQLCSTVDVNLGLHVRACLPCCCALNPTTLVLHPLSGAPRRAQAHPRRRSQPAGEAAAAAGHLWGRPGRHSAAEDPQGRNAGRCRDGG